MDRHYDVEIGGVLPLISLVGVVGLWRQSTGRTFLSPYQDRCKQLRIEYTGGDRDTHTASDNGPGVIITGLLFSFPLLPHNPFPIPALHQPTAGFGSLSYGKVYKLQVGSVEGKQTTISSVCLQIRIIVHVLCLLFPLPRPGVAIWVSTTGASHSHLQLVVPSAPLETENSRCLRDRGLPYGCSDQISPSSYSIFHSVAK